jgi:drug/metabolite transporter (DMT)-like permease
VWAALIARRSGRDVPRRAWLGIGIALLGAFVLTGVDYSVSGRALFGDGLALVGALLAAAYVTIGEQVRRELSTATYTLIAYSASAVALFLGCLLTGSAISGYSSSDWWKIIALTAAAQLLGHTLISRVLRTTSATVTSLAILFEMPGATLVAAIWLRQVPSVAIWPAVALLFAGLSLVIASGDRETLLESPPG